jgi:hypothetical protein
MGLYPRSNYCHSVMYSGLLPLALRKGTYVEKATPRRDSWDCVGPSRFTSAYFRGRHGLPTRHWKAHWPPRSFGLCPLHCDLSLDRLSVKARSLSATCNKPCKFGYRAIRGHRGRSPEECVASETSVHVLTYEDRNAPKSSLLSAHLSDLSGLETCQRPMRTRPAS